MTSNIETDGWRDTAERLFNKTGFAVLWVIFLGLVLTFLVWPIRNVLLVCWVFGTHAYFQEGIRVLKGKPVRFSNGEVAPSLPDIVTGFGAFFVTAFGLTFLLILSVRLYERYHQKPQISGH